MTRVLTSFPFLSPPDDCTSIFRTAGGRCCDWHDRCPAACAKHQGQRPATTRASTYLSPSLFFPRMPSAFFNGQTKHSRVQVRAHSLTAGYTLTRLPRWRKCGALYLIKHIIPLVFSLSSLFLPKTNSEFTKLLKHHKENTGFPVIVDYYSDGCGPCRQIAPMYRQVRPRKKEKERNRS